MMDVQKVQYIKHHKSLMDQVEVYNVLPMQFVRYYHGRRIFPASWKPSDMDEILHKGYMLYQYIGKLGRLLPIDIPRYISVDEMNYGLIEMQAYIGSFTSGQKDFNITTIDMLRDVFKEFGTFCYASEKVHQSY